ncbi:hypothetical protein WN51_11564 [Melipona quadrifasciata]|uniref:Uncharacterized protein n=1 Tax=Melipona quadrifasciata TaxID=166423 RepID=A0A0M9A311_9HYME|nr:hypothetical protein WN51_11564 [Melipona quadrifasciata]
MTVERRLAFLRDIKTSCDTLKGQTVQLNYKQGESFPSPSDSLADANRVSQISIESEFDVKWFEIYLMDHLIESFDV